MEEIRKLEKTIDMDAFIRWLLRKWKSGFLAVLIAAAIGGGLGVLKPEEPEEPEERILTEEENDEVEEYFSYNVYIEETLDIIGLLEKDIKGSLGTAADTKMINEKVLELADKMELLETYKTYQSSIAGVQNDLQRNFNEAQEAYIDKIRTEERKAAGEEVEDTSKKESIIRKIKSGIKMGALLGLAAAGIWAFANIFSFGLNKKIKSKEDVLAICGELPVIEGTRGMIRTGKVQVGNNLGLGKFLSQEGLGVVDLSGKKMTFDVGICNDKLAESLEKDIAEDMKVVLIVEIGVSRYEDVMKMKERCGDRLAGCLCIG